MNQDCGQSGIASVGIEKAIGVWSRAKVVVTKRPAGVETLTFLFWKRDSAELLRSKALKAICTRTSTQSDYLKIYSTFGRATRF